MSDSAARGGSGGSEAEAPESDAGGSAGTSEFDERSLLFLVVPEVVAFAGLCVVLASSVLGDGTLLASYPPWLRIAGFCVAAVQCLVVVGCTSTCGAAPRWGRCGSTPPRCPS